MTKTTSIMGSPLYMSPEQLSSSRNVDARADIWAIGVILFEIISGRVPFEAETMPQLCGMVLQEAPPSLRGLRGDVPLGLEAVVMRCLAKDRAQRFPSVSELAAALAPFGPPSAARSAERIARVLRGSGLQSLASTPRDAVQAATARDATLPAVPVRARSNAALYVVLPLAVAALAGGAFLALRKSSAANEHALTPDIASAPVSAVALALPAPPPSPSAVNVALPQPSLQPLAVASVASVASAAPRQQPKAPRVVTSKHAAAGPTRAAAAAPATPAATPVLAAPAESPLDGRR